MKRLIVLFVAFSFWACHSQSANNVVIKSSGLQKTLSCDSLIKRLIKSSENKKPNYWSDASIDRRGDSIVIEIHLDTDLDRRFLLLPKSEQLKDILLAPAKDLRYDTQTMALIKSNCQLSK